MTNVFIVLNSHIYESGDEVMSVWATEQLAQTEVERLQKTAKAAGVTTYSFYYIERPLYGN